MTTIMIGKALATVTENEILTSGMINAKIKFEFSDDWYPALSKTAIFTAGDVTKVVLDSYWENNVCSIPQECLAKSDEILMVGIYGVDNANVVAIPTVWATVGKIRKGYEGYEDVSTGTLPIWAQVQSAAAQSATAAKNAQDAAEVAQGKAEDAQAAAEAAQAKAETAQSKAETAQSKAETAQGKAESAQSAAESAAASASGSASAAAESAASASASETASAQSAQTATEKASAAQTAAQTAQSAKADAESAKAAAVTAGASAESANASAQSAKSDAESAKAAAQAAQSKAEAANTSAQTAKADAEAANTSAQSAKTAAESAKSAAAGSAQSAGASAQSAQASGKLSESWAVGGTGTRTGEDTNNAKYWAMAAQGAAGGGVSSFNGRSGAVAPQIGDYTAEMVGADAQGAAQTVQGNLNTHAENSVKHITAEERTAWDAKLNASELPTAINTALSQAKASGEFDGAPGQNGITPSIGDNGNWYLGNTDTGKPSRGEKGSDANVTADNIEAALGYTPANDADVESLSSNQSALSARMDTFTALGEGSTTGDAELMDARVDCEGKTWDNAGGHIRGITEKIIDACCDKVISGSDNYNLFKTSEVTYQYRLDNNSEELVSSNEYNMVSGWIPVEYGKYYTFSILYNGARVTNIEDASSPIKRIHVKLLDGSVLLIQQDALRKNADGTGITNSFSTIRANIQNMVAVRMQISMQTVTPSPSTEEIMKTYEPMFTASDASTGIEAHNYALSLPYMDGDAVIEQNIEYFLKHDDTKADRTEIEAVKSDVSELSEGSTTRDAELMDARVDCEGKTWDNAGGHIRGITGKIIDACCDKVIVGPDNYNLFKTSEVTYQYRLQDNSEELVSSNEYNMVSGWIPVEYGKYYTFSVLYNGARATNFGNTESPLKRIHVKLLDGSVLLIQQGALRKNADGTGITYSFSTIRANIPNMVAVRMQISMYGVTPYPSTEEIMKTYEPMFTASDASTGEEAHNYALSLPYMDGDAEGGTEVFYQLKKDETKADRTEVETVKSDVSELRNRKVSVSPKYNGNYIPNDRFLRGIANMRDSADAKEFEITIHNNSGATIKNAAIAVGMHNTVGINPANNNLPFQVYDNVFSKPTGFKFYDGDTELPYYIESESDCNYIVDKNIKTDQKTMAVFSDGKIAVYNATKARMQLSADDGISWTNICDNITSRPYRVLLPDSQDNLFVASHDGKKLYKYTSVDGYKAGAEVIDLTDTDTCIGSILAEDSVGNLYLGTYQTVFHCVVRKSTDHGNTWSIVFDVTNCQHVHNIFVNKKVIPNEIFIGLDNSGASTVETWVSKDAGDTWTKVPVPYGNRDYAFRYAGENFYIGCGERLYLGGATLYKTTDYNDPNAYYPLFDNGQGIRDIINVIDGSDDVLIAGGCVDIAVNQQQLFLSEDRGETWKTVLINPYGTKQDAAGKGLRTFSRKGNQILSETSTGYAMRFIYGNGAKTVLAIVNVGDIPVAGKTITLKTGYVANIEQMDDVLTAYENIDGKVADIQICDGYIVDKVSNKRVMTDKTEMVNSRIKIGQTSEYKILAESAYRLNDSINLGELSRLNFTKGFTVSLLFRKEDGKKYLEDYNEYPIFQSGETKLVLYRRSLRLMSGSTSIWGDKLYIQDSHLGSVNEDYVRLTVYFTADGLPSAGIYTENKRIGVAACSEYPITQNLSENDFIVGSSLAGAPNIARIEIYNRVLTHGEIMALTNGCNLVTDGSGFN